MDRIEDNILIFVSGSTSFVPTRKKQLSLLKYTCRSFHLVQLVTRKKKKETRNAEKVWIVGRRVDNAECVRGKSDTADH